MYDRLSKTTNQPTKPRNNKLNKQTYTKCSSSDLEKFKTVQQDKNLLYSHEHCDINFRYPTYGQWTSSRIIRTQYSFSL